MSERSRIADGFLGYDVDGSADGRCAEECGTSAAYYFHAVYHVGRNLFQAIYAVK